jgi:hypothetical protein
MTPTAVAEAAVVATATSAATRAPATTAVRKAVTEASVVKKVVTEANVIKKAATVGEKGARSTASAGMRVVEAMVEARDVRITALSVATREVAMAMTVPVEARVDMAETTDARNPPATVTDPAVDQDTAAAATKTSTAHKLNAMTAVPAAVAEEDTAVTNADTKAATADMVAETTPTTTVLQEVKKVAATRATEATLALTEASSHPAHHTEAATVEALAAQTSSLAPPSTLSPVEVALATPTSSAWLSVC